MTGTDKTRVGHCKRDTTDVYIGRGPDGVAFGDVAPSDRGGLGNPYSVEEYGRETCIALFREDFEEAIADDVDLREFVASLHGQTLGCWCRSFDEDSPTCHGDVIVEWADRLAGRTDPDPSVTDRYLVAEDLPYGAVAAANTLDETAKELPESEWLPVGVETRWQATVRLLSDLERRRDLDVVRILLQLARLGHLDTEDVERALDREAKLMRSNRDDDRPGGRPSKVDRLAREIGASCSVAERGGYDGVSDQTAARNRQIWQTLRDADMSRSTYYRLRIVCSPNTASILPRLSRPPNSFYNCWWDKRLRGRHDHYRLVNSQGQFAGAIGSVVVAVGCLTKNPAQSPRSLFGKTHGSIWLSGSTGQSLTR